MTQTVQLSKSLMLEQNVVLKIYLQNFHFVSLEIIAKGKVNFAKIRKRHFSQPLQQIKLGMIHSTVYIWHNTLKTEIEVTCRQ